MSEQRKSIVDEPQYEETPPELLIAFAKSWASLGDAVQRQVSAMLSGDIADCNPNAIAMAREALYGYNAEIDIEFDEYVNMIYEGEE